MAAKKKNKKMLIAIVMGLLTSFAVFGLLNSQKSQLVQQQTEVEQLKKMIEEEKKKSESTNGSQIGNLLNLNKVVFAKGAIKTGAVLTADMLEVREMTNGGDVPKDGYNNINQLVGRTMVADAAGGAYITKAMVADVTVNEVVIPVGMRAMTIPIEFFQGTASYLSVGSRIDLLTFGKADKPNSDFVIENIKILSLEYTTGTVKENSVPTTKATAITLEVPATKVPTIVEAINGGKLQIVARNHKDSKTVSRGIKRRPQGSSNTSAGGFTGINTKIPPPPQDIRYLGNKGFSTLPDPASPPMSPNSKKVELIQANVKSDVTFANDL